MRAASFASALIALLLANPVSEALAQKKHVEIPDTIPYGIDLKPGGDQPVFAVCSKQGGRVLVSRDDGRTWNQEFLATESLEDGGWHGTFAVYGMAATNGVIGIFSGWGTPGVYIGSSDGVHWGHFNSTPAQLGSVWGAAAGNGVFLTSADQWRGMTTIAPPYTAVEPHSLKSVLDGGKTHHMIAGFGDYKGGRFIIIGDNHHVFYSDKAGQNWRRSEVPSVAGADGKGQDGIAFGNDLFVVSYPNGVVRSDDGGITWTFHDAGIEGKRLAWRGLSFVNGEFWLTGRNGAFARRSKDGVEWTDLPRGTPGGSFVQSESGTIINVERQRYDIKRSEDGVRWESVFTPPTEDVTWDTAFAVFAKINRIK